MICSPSCPNRVWASVLVVMPVVVREGSEPRWMVLFLVQHLPFFVLEENVAELHALVADPGSMTGDQAIDLALGLPAERAVDILLFKSVILVPVQSETTSRKRIKGTAESIPLKRLIFRV